MLPSPSSGECWWSDPLAFFKSSNKHVSQHVSSRSSCNLVPRDMCMYTTHYSHELKHEQARYLHSITHKKAGLCSSNRAQHGREKALCRLGRWWEGSKLLASYVYCSLLLLVLFLWDFRLKAKERSIISYIPPSEELATLEVG